VEIDRQIDCSVYKGCTVDVFSLSAAKGGLLIARFDLIAKDETDGQTPTVGLSPSTKLPYSFTVGSVKVNDAAVAYVRAVELSIMNHVDPEGFVLNASKSRAFAYKGALEITGTLECEWDTNADALRDALLANTQKKLELFFTSTEQIEAGYYYTLTVVIPKIHILGDMPTVGGKERIPLSMKFKAVYDSTNTIKITHRDARTTKWSA